MLLVTVALLALLTLWMWRISGSMLFPPALYCGIWALTLGGLLLAGQLFLPLTEEVCLLYLVGAVSFALGGAICLSCLGTTATESAGWRAPPGTRAALDFILMFLILLLPYFLHLAITIAGTSNPIVMVQYIRQISVEGGGSPYGPVANLTVLAPLVALAMTYESDGSFARRARTVLAALVALAYSILTGSKGGALVLVSVFFVPQIKARRISVKIAVTTFVLFASFFGAGLLAVNMGGQTGGGTNAVAQEVGARALNYWLGAPVAFSGIAQAPESLPSSESIDRFFLETANSLGMRNNIPSINPPYTVIEREGANTNTYTIYFSYFKDFGWLGAVLLMAALGAALTWAWHRAMAGGPVAVLFYATFCTAVIQSIYSENFFLNINFDIKAAVFFLGIYRVCPAAFAAISLRTARGASDHEPAWREEG